MTGRTTPAAAPAEQVERAIEAMVGRLLAVRVVHHGYWWVVAGIGAAAVTAVARRLSPAEAVLWLMAALVASLALAWCTARHRGPDAAVAARAIDARLGLRGLVSAARELSGESDVVSALIVRDAAARIERGAPERLVPFHGPGRRAAAGLAIAAVAWLMAVSLGGRPVPAAGADARATGGAGGFTSVRPAAGDTGATADEATPVDGAPPPGATDAGSRRADAAADARAPAGGSERPQTAAAPTVGVPRPGAATPPGVEAGDASAVSQSLTGARDGAGGRGGGADGRAPQDDPAPARAGERADSLSGAGGQGRGSAATSNAAGTGRGGGASGGQALLEAAATPGDGIRPGAVDYEARYRAARARAESPAGRARIPPDMRRLVRDYFIGIGPGAPE